MDSATEVKHQMTTSVTTGELLSIYHNYNLVNKRTSTNRRILVSRPRALIEGAWFSAQFSAQQLVSTLLYRCYM